MNEPTEAIEIYIILIADEWLLKLKLFDTKTFGSLWLFFLGEYMLTWYIKPFKMISSQNTAYNLFNRKLYKRELCLIFFNINLPFLELFYNLYIYNICSFSTWVLMCIKYAKKSLFFFCYTGSHLIYIYIYICLCVYICIQTFLSWHINTLLKLGIKSD